jgi:hypothetical protein
LPISRAIKIASPATSHGSIPATPTTPSLDQFSVTERDEPTPPTPSALPNKFSQSMRAPSPAFRPKSRPSLPRPESPLRRAQAPPPATTPGGRQSLNMLSTNRLPGPRYAASPTPAKMGGSMKAPSKARPTVTPSRTTSSAMGDASSSDSSEITRLQNIIAEKNAKIAAITADFDAHRADFRSTLDTLELASTETERVYEKKVEDLLEERRLLMAQGEDVENVAQQLRQLEEVVQELEEGLEDARRGEAEARGEVEFLRGEVERVRAELRRERERNVVLVHEVDDLRRTRPRGKTGARAPSRANGINEESSLQQETGVVKSRTNTLSSPEPPKALSPQPSPEPSHEITPETEQQVKVPSSPAEKATTSKPVPEPVENDPDKWCALCEQDGHDSISCPYDKT